MMRALEYRTAYFLRAGVIGGVVGALALIAASSFASPLEPDALTWGLFVFAIAELGFFAVASFAPRRVAANVGRARFRAERPQQHSPDKATPFRFRARRLIGQEVPETLEQVGRTLALMGAAFMLHPILFGMVCVTLSGDAWRELIFVPVAALAGAVYWTRIGNALRMLEQSGF
jgi:hypothetical protein